MLGVNHLKELPDDQWNGLDPLDFLLRAYELTLEVPGLVLEVVLLGLKELDLLLKFLHALVKVAV